ncbi:MAG: hypothetical protein K0R54_1359 [Clostridiaceae bacterium]|jgi:hypothetical protein|nr:hypothetical protein [Clostridiaceae bacterium]
MFQRKQNNKKRVLSLAAVIILLIFTAYIVKSSMDNKDISKISYRNRSYLYSNEQIDKSKSSPDLIKAFQESRSTGVTTKGMEVYDIDKNSKNVSTVIFLKTKQNKFLIYSLSGGP